jgi:hypothetical protein
MNLNGRNGSVDRNRCVYLHDISFLFRTQPQPILPGGFAHKLSKNYYFERDARRQVGQPQVLFSTAANNQLLANSVAQPYESMIMISMMYLSIVCSQLAANTNASTSTSTSNTSSSFVSIVEAEKLTATLLANKNEQKSHATLRTPGKVYNWDG